VHIFTGTSSTECCNPSSSRSFGRLAAWRGFSPADPRERYKDSEQLIRGGEKKQNPKIYLPRRQQPGGGALRFPKLRHIVERKARAERIKELLSSICKHQNPDRSSQNCRTQESSPTEIVWYILEYLLPFNCSIYLTNIFDTPI